MPADLVHLYERLPATGDVAWWRELAAASPDGRVLYIGCGTGRLAAPIALAADTLIGVDVDRGMIDAFRRRVARDPQLVDRVQLVEGTAEHLPVPGTHGLVIMPSNLLNGITDPASRTAAVVNAAARCLPEGRVVLQVLNPYWLACEDPASRGRIDAGGDVPAIDVEVRRTSYDAWTQRYTGEIGYRFADGDQVTDHIDAVALFPRELRALAYQAKLRIERMWGARPGEDPLGVEGGTWHLVCRPDPDRA